MARGRIIEAKLVLRKAAKLNKVVLPEEFCLTKLEQEKLETDKRKKKKNYNAENPKTKDEMVKFTSLPDGPQKDEVDMDESGHIESNGPMSNWMRRASTMIVEQFEDKPKGGEGH